MARSTFASQNAQNTAISDLFWKSRCSKMARRCGAKHICKSKCAKHSNLGPILEVPMFKNGTPLWREAHLQVKMRKTQRSRTYFGSSDVQKWHAAVAKHICKSKCGKTDGYGPLFGGLMSKNCTPLWREAHLQVKMLKTPAFCSIFRRLKLTSSLTD